jgi:DNA-binding LytR/AlgR family response regulator
MAKHHAKTEKREIKNPNNVIFIKVKKDLIKINLQDIFTINGVHNDATIDIGRKKYKAVITLREFKKKLPENDFMWIQKDCIARIDKITAIKDNVCTIGDKQIPASRRFSPRLKSRLTII